MFSNYLVTALRNLFRDKLYTAINIGGLAVGLAACLLIIVFVRDEFGYDSFVPVAERTYRLDITFIHEGRADEHGPTWMGGYGQLLKAASSDIEEVTRYVSSRVTVKTGDRMAYERVTFADPNVLDFFGFSVPPGVLEDQSAIVLTQSMADKYYAGGNAVGQTLTLSGNMDYKVAAVIPDLPVKTHLAFSIIAPLHETEHEWVNQEFMSGNTHTYVRMKAGRSTEPLHALITELIDSHVEPRAGGKLASAGRVTTFVPVADIYLKSKGGVAYKPDGDILVVNGFMLVALLILIVASVNYVNLSTARAMQRAKEIGLRKVLGARRSQLIAQFLGESLVLTSIALALALAMVELVSPFINSYLGRDVALGFQLDLQILVLMLGLALLVGIGAGIYPALYLSSFKPNAALKHMAAGRRSNHFRQLLVFMQFAIAIALIAGTSVVVRQTVYASTMDPGFNKQGVLLIRGLRKNDLIPQAQIISEAMSSVPDVSQVVPSQYVPTDLSEWNSNMHSPDAPGDEFSLNILSHSFDFFDLYGIQTIAGRGLEQGRGEDVISTFPEEGTNIRANAVVNEKALVLLGIESPETAIGHEIIWSPEGRSIRFTVVGVINNFHIRSVRDQIKPMIYFNMPDLFRTISLRYNTDDFTGLLGNIETAWTTFAPGVPLDYQVLEDRVGQFYESERRQTRVFVTFALLAALIAAIGLYGLAAFAAERRTLEIGIRKTLGASTTDIVTLIVPQFLKPVLLANLVALPIAWWLAGQWLENFVYRVEMQPQWFLAAGLIALLIASVTVAGHTRRVGRANPIHALRYE